MSLPHTFQSKQVPVRYSNKLSDERRKTQFAEPEAVLSA